MITVDRRRRFWVAGLSIAAAALLASSIGFPFWKMTLVAPQYPQGLHLNVYPNRLTGDVSELDIINHYIGMKKMEEGAKSEQTLGLYAVAVASLLTIYFFAFSGRRLMTYLTLPALVFPAVFTLEMYYWLYKFGHDLDPHAPIQVPPFAPTFLGEGKVFQFTTIGTLGTGFYMAVAATVLVAIALGIRRRVCRECPEREKCSVTCARGYLLRVPSYGSPSSVPSESSPSPPPQ